MKKKTLLTLLVSLLTLNLWADINAIRITSDADTPVTLLLSQRPVIRFADADLLLAAPDFEARFALNQHPVATFIDTEADALDQIRGIDPHFLIEKEQLKAFGLHPGSQFSVYSLDGKMVGNATVNDQGQATVFLREAGSYIVRTQETSFKIMTSRR